MSNKIILKKSSVPAKVPQPADLLYGEVALNYADGKLYYKTANNEIKVLGTNLTVSVYDALQETFVEDVKKVRFSNTDFSLTDVGNNTVEISLLPTAGTAGSNPLVFTIDNNYRLLTGYTESGITYTVRTAEFINSKLRLTLAGFTPAMSTAITPGATLNWDAPATGFTVSVTNPTDFVDQWISDISSITATTGSVSAANTFNAGSKTATPAGGVSWNASYSVDADSYIRPTSTTITGGSAAGNIRFVVTSASGSSEYPVDTPWTVSWNTPTTSIAMNNLSGSTFLQSYTSTPYTVTVTNMASAANYTNSVTATGGTANNATGSGTLTFTNPIHKDNVLETRTMQVNTTFTRPASVTGTSYTAQLTASDLTLTAAFSYPSLWVYTVNVLTPPTVSDLVSGTTFKTGVTVLGDQVKTLSGFINNTQSVPQAFWFAIKSIAAQPTSFKTGVTASLLNDVSVTTGNTVMLQPSPTPSGFLAVQYNLYGFTLQPGSTYVSIS